MNEEKQFKPGDMVQHKANGIFGVVISEENQDKEIEIRNSYGVLIRYYSFELVKVDDNIQEDRLINFRKFEVFNRGNIDNK